MFDKNLYSGSFIGALYTFNCGDFIILILSFGTILNYRNSVFWIHFEIRKEIIIYKKKFKTDIVYSFNKINLFFLYIKHA